jgi:hypothetical protein
MRKTRERRRQNRHVVTIEVQVTLPKSAWHGDR